MRRCRLTVVDIEDYPKGYHICKVSRNFPQRLLPRYFKKLLKSCLTVDTPSSLRPGRQPRDCLVLIHLVWARQPEGCTAAVSFADLNYHGSNRDRSCEKSFQKL